MYFILFSYLFHIAVILYAAFPICIVLRSYHSHICVHMYFILCSYVVRGSKQRVDTPKVGGAHNATEDEFVMHSVPRCLDSQGEKFQDVGLSGARVGESLPQHDLKARTSLTPRSSWGDDLSPGRLCFLGRARHPVAHRCHSMPT